MNTAELIYQESKKLPEFDSTIGCAEVRSASLYCSP